MKRILPAALLALGIHGFLLGMECRWLERIPLERTKDPVMTMTLAVMEPPRDPIKKVEQKTQQIPAKRPTRSKALKKNREDTRIPKPKQQKTIQPPVQAMKQDLTETIVDVKPEPLNGIEQIEIETIPEAAATKKISVPEIKTIIEARPLYRANPPPKYPTMARKRGYTGNVVLEVLVGRNGSVVDLRVFSSSGHTILDKAAISSVKNWTFEPGTRGDEKIAMWVRVPIRFELK